MQRLKPVLLLGCVITMLSMLPLLRAQPPTGATAEAIGTANLRATTDVNSTLLGGIQSGTRYPVLGRSQFYPWYLLADPVTNQPLGWVYAELVNVQGDLNSIPFSAVEVGVTLLPTATLDSAELLVTATNAASSAVTATPAGRVSGIVLNEINIRYGPGIEYPRVGIAHAGESYMITAYHTQFPWVEISYPTAPDGAGWVAVDLLQIEGDIFSLPAISQTRFDLPTLTPTPAVIQSSALLGATPVALSPEFQALGSQLWNMILKAGFEPDSSRLGALFLMDLQTGEAITFGNNLAFSGMSINKIAILSGLYNRLNTQPNANDALTIANMMICSENSATNGVLNLIGNGDEYRGAQVVTDFLGQLGLKNTFIVAPFLIPGVSTPQPVRAPTTLVDQNSTEPDYSNQMTVDEMGWLLGSIYQCAYNDGGPFRSGPLSDNYTAQECHKMLRLMSENQIGALIEAGVPKDTVVAHKHGWIDDTHGDAGIVITPGGNYVLVMALHNPTWLDFNESFPLMAEISRTVYNYYNPDGPVSEIRREQVSETCELPDMLISDLMSPAFAG
jgi:hypothetical protein